MAKPARPRPPIRFSRVPQGIANAGAWRIERQLRRGTVTDVLHIHENTWRKAKTRLGAIAWLAEQPHPLAKHIANIADRLIVSRRSVERWLRAYRKNPDIMALMPRSRGPSIANRRIIPERESLLQSVIDDWARAGEQLPVTWIREECARRGRGQRIPTPSRSCVDARLRDRGLESMRQRRYSAPAASNDPVTPKSSIPLQIVQIDHTLVDVMVVDELHRKSMGRPWITVAFDIATRCVLGFQLSLRAPSVVSVGLTLAMSGVPKGPWLKERKLTFDWPMYGIPKMLHLDNGTEFHSIAMTRGCDRYGIDLEYRPPGRPHFGGHIERYLGTLMGRIHGLAGTTFSSPAKRGKYQSERHASMTLSELERWIALEIAGRYHHFVNRGVHAVPARLWSAAVQKHPVTPVADPARFVMDFLPAEMRKVGRDGFQINRIRYWDPIVSRLFPAGTQILVRFDPRDLSKVFVPSPDNSGYLQIPYADLRRPPITLAELERAKALLADRGEPHLQENVIFKAADELRQIEDAAAKSTRRARRNREIRPPAVSPATAVRANGSKPEYDKAAKPSKGENW